MKKKLLLLCVLCSCSVISDVFVKSVANQEFALGTLESGVYSQYIATFDSGGDFTLCIDKSWGFDNGSTSTANFELVETISDTVGIYENITKYAKVEVDDNSIIIYDLSVSKNGAIAQDKVYLTLNKSE